MSLAFSTKADLRRVRLAAGLLLVAALAVWFAAVRFGAFEALVALNAAYPHVEIDEIVVLAVVAALAVLVHAVWQTRLLRREIVRRAEAERVSDRLARYDTLTGLANRRLFIDRLHELLAAGRAARDQAVLVIDLDRFKQVNDRHGRAAGDLVIGAAATRLRRLCGPEALIARLGADEFAVLSDAGGDGPARLAARLLDAFGEPVALSGGEASVGATIGIARAGSDGRDAERLLRAADLAMGEAKRQGGGRARFFEASMEADLQARTALEAEVRRAVAEGEIVPHYQPLVDLRDGEVVGYEILARWQHPTRGLLPPAGFITVAEELGLIGELTYGLLHRACRDAVLWPAHLRLSINMCPSQLRDRAMPGRVLLILSEAGFAPGRLEIEITENALVADIETARGVLATLRGVGVGLALDDFGTGYSGLYHLRELRFDRLKIDRSFVAAMRRDGDSCRLVGAIIDLGRALGMSTTAEGIEDAATAEALHEMGCIYGQGFWFGRPAPAAAVLEAQGAAPCAREAAA